MKQKTNVVIEDLNYTPVPNVIFDHMMKQYTDEPWAVVIFLAICRKTIGWHKRTDSLAYSQLRELTGYSKPTIAKYTKMLADDGWIIIMSPEKSGLPYKFDINIQNMKNQLTQFTGSNDKEPVNPINHHQLTPFTGTDKPHLLTKEIKETINKIPERNALELCSSIHSNKQPLERNIQGASAELPLQDIQPSKVESSSPAKQLAEWIFNDWYKMYGKAARKNLLVQALYEGIPDIKTLSREQALGIQSRMIEHTRWYTSVTPLQFLASPVNYLKDKKWEEAFDRKLQTKQTTEDFSKANGGTTTNMNQFKTYAK